MPKCKLYSEREAFKEPPPEPAPFSKLEQFDWNQTMYQTYVLPKPLFDKLETIPDKEKFICQCLLDLINDARGVERQEPAKPREAWYSYTKKIPTQRLFKFEHHDDKVRPYYEVEAQYTRKRIPNLPGDEQVIFLEPNQHQQRQAGNFQVSVRLHNEFFRLAEAFQMTLYDAHLQAIERGVWKWEQNQPQPINPNAARYRRFSDRDQQREDRLTETVAKRISKNIPKEPA